MTLREQDQNATTVAEANENLAVTPEKQEKIENPKDDDNTPSIAEKLEAVSPFDKKSGTTEQNYLSDLLYNKGRGLFLYNENKEDVYVMEPLPRWGNNCEYEDFKNFPRPIDERSDFSSFKTFLKYEKNIKISKDDISGLIYATARTYAYNPLRDIVNNWVTWDGKPRIHNILARIFRYKNLTKAEAEYYALAGFTLFTGIIARALQDDKNPFPFQYMFILTGRQGTGKSRFPMVLAFGNEYFIRNPDISRHEDFIRAIQGMQIAAIDELVSFNKASEDQIKAFVGSEVDNLNPKFGKHINKARLVILFGSDNNNSFITDSTNRRFPILKVDNEIDFDLFLAEKEQVYAEAIHIVKTMERDELIKEQAKATAHPVCIRYQNENRKIDEADIQLQQWLRSHDDNVLLFNSIYQGTMTVGRRYVLFNDLVTELRKERIKISPAELNKKLKIHGFVSTRITINNERLTVWHNKKIKKEDLLYKEVHSSIF